ncbi:Acetone carboxylase beta subunit [Staphylococcus piscifermentans]|uniref:5-oxoprolinase n=1 Tax=Staphylococcus piscifermentans TaxID=70258 RepID=A0A239TH48_9STAP|nr:hydantoinase/oxoprolinase family protein [Staphylococcus piscifermentans]RTX85362.1 hydantoinase/oxoprolinase family protein [Staphylococcus piscifermentans]GEP85538.1 5-oxoprolinase [Staphylococcus piscifermentans]SNU96819.1 Acetone carboxylase beta subunit [Staphylococcus piscifermentans]
MRVATDIGGTFTDLVALDNNGELILGKSDTTPKNFEAGIFNVLEKADINLRDISMFIHGTTIVINALTEKKGVKTGLITTKGFRDVLEIGRGNRPDLFNVRYKKPEPIVERHLRKEVSERLNHKGDELSPVNFDEVEEIIQYFKQEGVEAIAISLLHSYQNNEHEVAIANYINDNYPEFSTTYSTELNNEWREYERTYTAVLNAYVKPIANEYLTNLENNITEKSSSSNNYVMQSNGGTSTFKHTKQAPINMVESGPVSGIFGAAVLGEILGENNLIVLDIGGTTAKCSLIENNNVKVSTDYHLERTNNFAGYPMKVPVVDIVEIGNGGGSIAWFDDSGSIKVGPKSAGAEPGPIAYGKGGTEPTTTDANLLLGRLNIANFDTKVTINDLKKQFEKTFTKKLNVDLDAAAMGIIKIANSNMLNALKLISVRKGYDPRDFTMVAIGGGGPMHSQDLARELGVKKVIVPSASSVFASWGMLMSDLRHDYSQTFLANTSTLNYKDINLKYNQMIEDAINTLKQEDVNEEKIVVTKKIDLRYEGQDHPVEVTVPYEEVQENNLNEIIKSFHKKHEQLYTYTLPENGIEIVNIKISVLGKIDKPIIKKITPQKGDPVKEERNVYFENHGWEKVKIYNRDFLPIDEIFEGPAVIEEKSTTIPINPKDKVKKDEYGNLIIYIGGDNYEL